MSSQHLGVAMLTLRIEQREEATDLVGTPGSDEGTLSANPALARLLASVVLARLTEKVV